MKKITLPLLLAVGFVFQSYGQNLLQNGSFEGQDFLSWIHLAEGNSEGEFKLNTKDYVQGSSSLTIDAKTLGPNPWDIQMYQGFPSEKGKFYKLRFFAKAKKANTLIRVMLQKTSYLLKDFALTNEWKEYEYNFEAKEDNLKLVFQYFQLGVISMDAISIKQTSKLEEAKPVEIKSNSKNLVINGNLENGTDNWLNLDDNGANVQYSVSTNKPAKGKKALRIKVLELGTNPWDIQSIVSFASVRNGKYKLSFYARANNNGKKIRGQIQKHEEQIYLPKDYDLTTAWTKYEWEFGAQANDMQFSIQYMEKGSYEIDELKIEAIGKTKKNKKKK